MNMNIEKAKQIVLSVLILFVSFGSFLLCIWLRVVSIGNKRIGFDIEMYIAAARIKYYDLWSVDKMSELRLFIEKKNTGPGGGLSNNPAGLHSFRTTDLQPTKPPLNITCCYHTTMHSQKQSLISRAMDLMRAESHTPTFTNLTIERSALNNAENILKQQVRHEIRLKQITIKCSKYSDGNFKQNLNGEWIIPPYTDEYVHKKVLLYFHGKIEYLSIVCHCFFCIPVLFICFNCTRFTFKVELTLGVVQRWKEHSPQK